MRCVSFFTSGMHSRNGVLPSSHKLRIAEARIHRGGCKRDRIAEYKHKAKRASAHLLRALSATFFSELCSCFVGEKRRAEACAPGSYGPRARTFVSLASFALKSTRVKKKGSLRDTLMATHAFTHAAAAHCRLMSPLFLLPFPFTNAATFPPFRRCSRKSTPVQLSCARPSSTLFRVRLHPLTLRRFRVRFPSLSGLPPPLSPTLLPLHHGGLVCTRVSCTWSNFFPPSPRPHPIPRPSSSFIPVLARCWSPHAAPLSTAPPSPRFFAFPHLRVCVCVCVRVYSPLADRPALAVFCDALWKERNEKSALTQSPACRVREFAGRNSFAFSIKPPLTRLPLSCVVVSGSVCMRVCVFTCILS